MKRFLLTLLATFKGRGMANALRRAGVLVFPQLNLEGKYSGLRLQWEPDEHEISRGTIVDTVIDNERVRFFVMNELDEIQGNHRKGEFYEQEELSIIKRYFKGGTFVDIGANVGNHSLYSLIFLGASKVLAFEPLPEAYRLLEFNIALNGLDSRFILHKCALSDENGWATIDFDPQRIDNLGGTRLVRNDIKKTNIEFVKGDDVISELVNFIKIDTEGFELQVLRGLARTISQHRPLIFVEVENKNYDEFAILMQEFGYDIKDKFARYAENTNYLSVPSEIQKS